MTEHERPPIDAENGARYPRAWASRQGFVGWKIVVILAGVIGVPATLWMLYVLWRLFVAG